jgi:hypothetical protein
MGKKKRRIFLEVLDVNREKMRIENTKTNANQIKSNQMDGYDG